MGSGCALMTGKGFPPDLLFLRNSMTSTFCSPLMMTSKPQRHERSDLPASKPEPALLRVPPRDFSLDAFGNDIPHLDVSVRSHDERVGIPGLHRS